MRRSEECQHGKYSQPKWVWLSRRSCGGHIQNSKGIFTSAFLAFLMKYYMFCALVLHDFKVELFLC